tara:strand:- start:105 stop:440 length:336 start_codon:yes stop_codon:yes gene_type:complete
VLCPNCDYIFNVDELPRNSLTGWRIALVGILLSFNFYILGPVFLIVGGGHFNTSGVMIFLSIIGFPTALTGLIMAIAEKIKVNSKRILVEIFFICVVSNNGYLIMTMGSVG